MVKIRLARTGRKNRPSYRIVVIDSRAKRNGEYLELIGHYNPVEDPKKVVYKEDRYKYWTSVGAQPSSAVKKLISGKYVFKPYNPKAAPEGEGGGEVPAEEVSTEAPTEKANVETSAEVAPQEEQAS